MKNLLIVCFIFITACCQGQTVFKYYVYLYDSTNAPTFVESNGYSRYEGNDIGLQNFFNNYTIVSFKEAFPASDWESFKRVFILETTSALLVADLKENYSNIYRKFEDITNNKVELLSFPNDYGSTNPGVNLGPAIDREDLDYHNVPEAWDYTNGEGMTIGISDGRINNTNPDLQNVTFINPGHFQSLPYDPTPNGIGTWHGTGVAAVAAGRGDNAWGSTGVCQQCNIISTGHGNYNNLLLLAQAGVRVINMSWVSSMHSSKYPVGTQIGYEGERMAIDSLVNHYKVVLVAGAGNQASYQTNTDYFCTTGNINGPDYTGIRYGFPASYDGVISVSAVNHQFPLILPLTPSNNPNTYNSTSPTNICFGNIEDGFGGAISGNDPDNPVGMIFNGWARYCNPNLPNQYVSSPNGLQVYYTSNPDVDILAATDNTFSYHRFIEEGGLISYLNGGTSGSAPRVSGTAALMIDLNNCLVSDEVDDILKLTSKDVEQLSFNQIFAGQIGAGALDAGDAVQFVHEMKEETGTAVIDQHIFNRFNFNLERINNKLEISNATFKESCVAHFAARTQIHLKPGTILKPQGGSVHLEINPDIDICSAFNPQEKISSARKTKIETTVASFASLYPNPNSGLFTVTLKNITEFQNTEIKISILDINGRVLHSENLFAPNENQYNIPINMTSIPTGLYFVKIMSESHSESIKFIKV